MKENKRLVYSGDLLRKFLHRKKLTYKDAAKELGLDKNTIGKAVRGGNMNISVLLNIANRWNFPITDFFAFVSDDENGETHFISPNPYIAQMGDEDTIAAESVKMYKNTKRYATTEKQISDSKRQEIELLQNLIANYQERIRLLQYELKQSQTK